MSKDKPHNKKSPEGPQQSKRAKPEYPYVHGHADVCGRHHLVHADPSKPDESFIEDFRHDGSFTIHETLQDEKGMKNELLHHHRQYAQTKSSHTDGNHDIRAYNKSVVVDKDLGHQVGGDYHKGVGGKEIKAVAESNIARKGASDSKHNSFKSVSGDGSIHHGGNFFSYYEKDHGEAIDGSKYTILKDGEYGIHVQKGNMDTRIEQGKAHIHSTDEMSYTTNSTFVATSEKKMSLSSKDNIEATSEKKILITGKNEITLSDDSKIVIKVGQSKITIQSGSIKIEGTSITVDAGGSLDLKASGSIDIKGSTTKVQGGGMMAPPTTFA